MISEFLVPITVEDTKKATACSNGTVFIIDDEPDILLFIGSILRQEGFWVIVFPCATNLIDYLASESKRYPGPRCVLTDVNMPGLSGLELQLTLNEYTDLTFVMMSGLGHVQNVVDAFRQGAIHFLTKPIDADDLIDTINESLLQSKKISKFEQFNNELSSKFRSLTERELQVINLVFDGMLNKQIADLLEIGIRTVKIHRHNAYRKLNIIRTAQLAQYSSFFKNAKGIYK